MIGLFLWALFLAICGFGYPEGVIVVVLTILSPFIFWIVIVVVGGLFFLIEDVIKRF